MSESQPVRWRACAEQWCSGDADPTWTGRWRTVERAAEQALRWAADTERDLVAVWVESEDGRAYNITVGG